MLSLLMGEAGGGVVMPPEESTARFSVSSSTMVLVPDLSPTAVIQSS